MSLQAPHLSQGGAEEQLPGGEGTEEEAHRPGGEDQDGRGVGDPRSFDDFFSLELCLKIGFKKWLDHPWSEFPWVFLIQSDTIFQYDRMILNTLDASWCFFTFFRQQLAGFQIGFQWRLRRCRKMVVSKYLGDDPRLDTYRLES